MRRLHAEGPGKVEEEHPLKLVKEHHRYDGHATRAVLHLPVICNLPICAAFARDMRVVAPSSLHSPSLQPDELA